jgi:hypothetical protein
MSDSSACDMTDDSTPREWRYYTRRLRRHPVLRVWRQSSKRVKSVVPSLWRQVTNRHRQLPSIVIAGAQKAGTTQLFAYLITHPRLFPGCSKEVDYFSRKSKQTVAWYRSRFPLARRVATVNGHVIEASPSYMAWPAAIPRMHAVLPNARLVVILRDPVARAFSGYQHAKTRHRDSRSFEVAVEQELRNSIWRPELGFALRPGAPPLRTHVARGYYALQLASILNYYPCEQVLVLDSAELFADTNAVCQRVFDFVGIDSHEVVPEKVYNRGYYSEKISPQMTDLLREHYRPHDELLAQLLGRRFSWMTTTSPAAAA